MIKKLLFLSALSFIAVTAQAQIQSEDFEANTMPAGWTSEISGAGDWTFGSNIPPFAGNPTFASNAAIFNDDELGGEAEPSIASLLSPPIDVTSYATLNLSFDYYMNEISEEGLLNVEVYDGTAWQQLLNVTTDVINMTNVSFDVTAYKNAAFQVKFTFDDEGGWSWGTAIDNFLLSGSLSMADLSKSNFTVHPNPFNDVVTVASDFEVKNIAIHNITGSAVFSGTVSAERQLNLSGIPTGVYFMTTTFADDSVKTVKLVKK